VEGLWRTITHLGYVADHTMHQHAEDSVLRAKDFVEPRIEPEVMFGLKGAPLPRMSEAALLDCIEWVALGYEVVQTIFPGWNFAATDAVVANGMHGALLVGTRHAMAPRKTEWQRNWQLSMLSYVATEN
jgi:2-oxo-3-hexenedioate decarboxylase